MIQIKNTDVLLGMIDRAWHPKLVEIITWVSEKHGLCVTEGHRKALKPGDVHDTDPLRAFDMRSWFYKPDVAEQIEKEINARWQYDHQRPIMNCAWIHDTGRGIHFHIQVHNNTRRR